MALAIYTDATGKAHVIMARDRPDGTTEVRCSGSKRHHGRTGICPCVRALLAALPEDERGRVAVAKWGDWRTHRGHREALRQAGGE